MIFSIGALTYRNGPVTADELIGKPIAATLGQIDYEWAHLKAKLRLRAPSWLARLKHLSRPGPHPLFHLVPGVVAEWEVSQPSQRLQRKRR